MIYIVYSKHTYDDLFMVKAAERKRSAALDRVGIDYVDGLFFSKCFHLEILRDVLNELYYSKAKI